MYIYLYIHICIHTYTHIGVFIKIHIHTYTHIYYQADAMQAAWGVQVCENKKESNKSRERKELVCYFFVCTHKILFSIFYFFTLRKGSLSACCMCWCIFSSGPVVYSSILICVFFHIEIWRHVAFTGLRSPIGCLKLQVMFRKRATNYRALLWKIIYKDKASHGSTSPCNISCSVNFSLFVLSHLERNFSCWNVFLLLRVFSHVECIFSPWEYFLTLTVFSHFDGRRLSTNMIYVSLHALTLTYIHR